VGPDDSVYLLSRKDAPRGQILRLPLSQLEFSKAKVFVAQSSGTGADESGRTSIEDFEPTPGRLYVIDIIGGPSRIRVFDERGRSLPGPSLPPISAVDQLVPVGRGDVLFYISTYLEPSAWYRVDAATGNSTRTALFETSPTKFNDAEVVRSFAISKDGTRVPLNIIRRKGARLDGTNPVLLTGYGGYGISLKPSFAGSQTRVWLDQGGVSATANLRGGGEYGEEWHQQGNLTRKQYVFDDIIACAQYLVDQKYSSPAHLAISGGAMADC